jgi:hypothetical protein
MLAVTEFWMGIRHWGKAGVAMVWAEFGFTENPYATAPIPASADGDQLLVGRDAEIRELQGRILALGNHPTIEGDNGVGKTSLISVACYRLRRDIEEGQISPVLLPVSDDVFQLRTGESADEFVRKVYVRIASAIVEEHQFLKACGLNVPKVGDVREWLNSPMVKGWGGSVSALGAGAGLSRSRSANGGGFTEAGLMNTVNRWLRQLFPTAQAGGFLCILDNLELLETTADARGVLEAIRDPLLNHRGLRWILCGARGIVRTSASSPRLSGRLADPIEVGPISDHWVEAAIERRIERYRVSEDATAPVGPKSFLLLYDVLNRNLRVSFKFAEDFALWLYGEGQTAGTQDSFHDLFEVWLTTMADKHRDQTELGKRAWQVFDQLTDRGGACSPSDFTAFGFRAQNVMRTHIKALEAANLVTTMADDEHDKRRKTIMVTPRGWFVTYARSGYTPPTRVTV